MQSPQDSNSIPPEITERMQFLLSRQLDGDLASEDSSELAKIQKSESLNRYLASICQIRQQLASLPVEPVPSSFAASIRQAILDDSAKPRTSYVSGFYRGWVRRLVVPATIAVCALWLIVVLRPGRSENDSDLVALDAGRAVADHHVSAPTSDIVLADRPANLDSAVQSGTAVVADLTQEEELRPFLDSDDWRIVVVQVNSKDREDVMHDIEAIVAKNDMNIRTVVRHEDVNDKRFGVLLTSAGADEKDFINSVVPPADVKSADWDAQNVAESSRESLINRMQESLKTPTYSELHFGQVYVTVPKRSEPVDVAEQELVARNDVADDTTLPGPAGKKMAAMRSEAPISALPEPRKPVLVVFEFTEPAIDHI